MEKEIIYIVKNADYDGYNQQFHELPKYVGDIIDHVKQWQEDGYLKVGDIIYKCEKVGDVISTIKLKEE